MLMMMTIKDEKSIYIENIVSDLLFHISGWVNQLFFFF